MANDDKNNSGGSNKKESVSNLSAFVANRNWKVAMDRIQRSKNTDSTKVRVSRPVIKQGWNNFSQEQLELLFDIADEGSRELPEEDEVIRILSEGDFKFVRECFVTAMDHKDKDKFLLIFRMVDKAVGNGLMSNSDQLWPNLYPHLFKKAIDMGSVTSVRSLLATAHDSTPPRLPFKTFAKRPRPNDPALLAACKKDNYEMVKLFVSYGYRIKINYLSQNTRAARIARGESSWRDLADIPFLNEEPIGTGQAVDEIVDLHLLRMISKPSYIFACYVVVAEKKDIENENRQS